MSKNQSPIEGEILAVIVLILVSGSFSLALIDKDSRSAFADLTKVGVGGYIGLLIPRKKSS